MDARHNASSKGRKEEHNKENTDSFLEKNLGLHEK